MKSMIKSTISYLKGVVQELSHVRWPSRRLAIAYTILIIVASLILGVYTGVLDAIFTQGINLLISN